MHENEISKIVLDCAIKVHTTLGVGLLESAYQECLIYELEQASLSVQKEIDMPLIYKGLQLDKAYRIGILVENKVIIELKAVTEMSPTYKHQVLTYLRLSGCKLGLLINFHASRLIDGYERVVNRL
ncbi:MAG: hypothetical protein RI894_2185 [Bacteroidota bacterium]|jgi:GxxExxY protein